MRLVARLADEACDLAAGWRGDARAWMRRHGGAGGVARQIGASLGRHPYRWAMAVVGLCVVFPAVDLFVSGLFYRPDVGFPLRTAPWAEALRHDAPKLLIGIAVAVAALGVAGAALGRVVLKVTPAIALFVVSSLALGPGLVVNVLLKDHWGRARPSQIVEFGGTAHYTPPLVMADQCLTNCSFSSGHGALGFWVVALALLAPRPWRRPSVAAALAFGVLMSVVRVAQGGHFLSDVVVSGIIVVALTTWLHRRLVERG